MEISQARPASHATRPPNLRRAQARRIRRLILAFAAAGIVAGLAASGVNLGEPAPLFAATLVLSNVVSNVPAVMLLLPVAAHTLAGPTLALVSTLAGNLLIVGSIANIIVVDAAARRGIRIDWRRHARVGVPVTLATLAICAASLWWRLLPAA